MSSILSLSNNICDMVRLKLSLHKDLKIETVLTTDKNYTKKILHQINHNENLLTNI